MTPNLDYVDGLAAEASIGQIEHLSAAVKQWCTERNLPPLSWAEPLVVELYFIERVADAWKPAESNLKRGLKVSSIAKVPAALIAHGADCDVDMSRLVNHACITNLLGNCRRRLPFDQVTAVRAQPLTDERVETLLAYIDQLERTGLVHEVWACRWRAVIYVGRASALRSAEIVRMRFSWLDWEPKSLGESIGITVPRTKGTQSAETIVISAATPGGPEAIEALGDWKRTLDRLGYSTAGKSRVFPRVEEDRDARLPKHRPVAGKTLADFPHLAVEYTGKQEPSGIAAGSNKLAEWRCQECHRTWTTRVIYRTSRTSPCPYCSRNRPKAPLATAPGRDDVVMLSDRIASRETDPEFHPGKTGSRRTQTAIRIAREEFGAEYKKIALAAGLDPRSSFEGISAYGTRRGATVALANLDADRETIRKTLRHRHAQTATPYIEESDISLPPALIELKGWTLT